PARDLQIDDAFLDAVPLDEFRMQRAQIVMAERGRQRDLLQRAVEAGEMRLEIDQPPVEHGRHLIDAVAEEKGAVEDRDLRLCPGHIRAVHIDDAGHGVGRARKLKDLPSPASNGTQAWQAGSGEATLAFPDSELRAYS